MQTLASRQAIIRTSAQAFERDVKAAAIAAARARTINEALRRHGQARLQPAEYLAILRGLVESDR